MAWPVGTRAVIKAENNHNDDTGNYSPSDVDTPIYSGAIKHDDSYSLAHNGFSHQNLIQLPAQLTTDINSYDDFSISFWGYHETGKDFAFYTAKGGSINTGFLWCYTYVVTDIFVYRWHDNVSYSLSEFTAPGELDTWIHWAFTWEGTAGGNGILKIYKNNSLIATHAVIGSSFTINNDEFYVGGEGALTNFDNNAFVDNYIITNTIPANFPIVEISEPTISDVDPDVGSINGGTPITITGTNFLVSPTVTFDGDSATDIVRTGPTEITCKTPAHAPGAVDVVVTNTDTGTVTAVNGFTFVAAPSITSVDIIEPYAIGGQKITVTGINFSVDCTFFVDAVEQGNVELINTTTMTFITEPHAVGGANLTVDNGIETHTLYSAFTFVAIAYLNTAAIFEKNRLASDGAWIILLEIIVPGEDTLRVCRNTENVTWGGYVWIAFPFEMDQSAENSNNEIPVLTIRVSNVTRILQTYLEETNGAPNSTMQVRIVHSEHLEDADPVWEALYSVIQADCDEDWVSFQCGIKYSVTSRRPLYRYTKYSCPFAYGEVRCGVPDATIATFPTCEKTLTECEERSNEERFGAEPGIPGGYFG